MIELSKEARNRLDMAMLSRLTLSDRKAVLEALDCYDSAVAEVAETRAKYQAHARRWLEEDAAKYKAYEAKVVELSAANASAEAYRKAFDALKADFEAETRRGAASRKEVERSRVALKWAAGRVASVYHDVPEYKLMQEALAASPRPETEPTAAQVPHALMPSPTRMQSASEGRASTACEFGTPGCELTGTVGHWCAGRDGASFSAPLTTHRTFPVLSGATSRSGYDGPLEVPWAMVESARARAERNHSQSLERLAERGGLDPLELLAALDGKGLGGPSITQEAYTTAVIEAGRELARRVEKLSGPACACASIQRADPSRHFRECPMRAVYPEPAKGPATNGDDDSTWTAKRWADEYIAGCNSGMKWDHFDIERLEHYFKEAMAAARRLTRQAGSIPRILDSPETRHNVHPESAHEPTSAADKYDAALPAMRDELASRIVAEAHRQLDPVKAAVIADYDRSKLHVIGHNTFGAIAESGGAALGQSFGHVDARKPEAPAVEGPVRVTVMYFNGPDGADLAPRLKGPFDRPGLIPVATPVDYVRADIADRAVELATALLSATPIYPMHLHGDVRAFLDEYAKVVAK